MSASAIAAFRSAAPSVLAFGPPGAPPVKACGNTSKPIFLSRVVNLIVPVWRESLRRCVVVHHRGHDEQLATFVIIGNDGGDVWHVAAIVTPCKGPPPPTTRLGKRTPIAAIMCVFFDARTGR